ncbi:MAG: hypothetical protein RLY86_2145 [Pseudomonadota bacterium]|jgi:toxin CcdB
MGYYDVHRNTNPRTRARVPFLVDVQIDTLAATPLRVVVPLLRAGGINPVSPLNPAFTILDMPVILAPQEIAGVPTTLLGPAVASLLGERDRILRAIDFVLTGA